MKWLNVYRKRLVVVGVVAAVIVGGGNAKADFKFGEPVNLGQNINTSANDWGPSISADGLSFYFSSNRTGGYGNHDLYVATRPTKDDEWGTPINLGPTVNSSSIDLEPDISTDGLELYFESRRPGKFGVADIWVAKREREDDPWKEPVNLGPVINGLKPGTGEPSISFDGLQLYYLTGSLGGDADLFVSTRATTSDDWGVPVQLTQVNPPGVEWCPSISADGRVLVFGVSQQGASDDLWITIRDAVSGDWNPPDRLGTPINSSSDELSADISVDGQTLYIESNRPGGFGGYDIWQASIDPVVDLNGDGIVDVKDIVIITDHWGENYPLCDIGPMPWGDGIVDIQDLEVLIEYIEPIDRTLIAHWPLDEAEGDIAQDITVGDNDAVVIGDPVWQPAGGKAGGSLQFDGVDDYISTPFILNPSNGSLSAFTWIKGGAPGQVIISQTGDFGGTWLGINPSEGKLMTGFSDMYFGALVSETVITDVQWHHVGFVYDMDTFHRLLYVDGVLVAEDSYAVSGIPSDSGLNIGASKDLDSTSFFSGLIDDVRIYNRAVSP